MARRVRPVAGTSRQLMAPSTNATTVARRSTARTCFSRNRWSARPVAVTERAPAFEMLFSTLVIAWSTRRLSSDWESTRLKIELSPVQIREAALDSEFKCLRCCAGDFPAFLGPIYRPRAVTVTALRSTQLWLHRRSRIRTHVRTCVHTQVHERLPDFYCRSERIKILAYSLTVAAASSPAGRPCSHSTARTAS